ncbi:hypothetical protein GCM10025879_04130 [Leuconostoc litchii]|nr:hypothetical protein GCM10025879_04130 [Leuconostoc litchii]
MINNKTSATYTSVKIILIQKLLSMSINVLGIEKYCANGILSPNDTNGTISTIKMKIVICNL